MRKLIRIAVAIAMLAAIALVAPLPVSANHSCPPDLPSPVGPGQTAPPNCPDEGDGHEAIPDPEVVDPKVPCVVTGELFPGAAAESKNHLVPPAGNAASHSHYAFIQTSIACVEEGDTLPTSLPVSADGGNDGHLVDLATVPPTVVHPFNDHHGSTNESGWSHSSLYNGANTGGGASNECVDADGDGDGLDDNDNKGDIVVDPQGDPSNGWVKYVRVGVVIAVWGCFVDGPLATDNPHFSSQLALFPPAVFNNTAPFGLPECALPQVDDPGVGPPVPDPIIPPQEGCGFSIAGAAERGPNWL